MAKADQTVEHNGHRFWITWELARINKTYENGCWVLRWVKKDAFITYYC